MISLCDIGQLVGFAVMPRGVLEASIDDRGGGGGGGGGGGPTELHIANPKNTQALNFS